MKLKTGKFPGVLKGYFAAVGGIFLVTALLSPFHDEINSATVSLALLLIVLFVASYYNRNRTRSAERLDGRGINRGSVRNNYEFQITNYELNTVKAASLRYLPEIRNS